MLWHDEGQSTEWLCQKLLDQPGSTDTLDEVHLGKRLVCVEQILYLASQIHLPLNQLFCLRLCPCLPPATSCAGAKPSFHSATHIRNHAFLIVQNSLRSSRFTRRSFSCAQHCRVRANRRIAPQPHSSLPLPASRTSRSIRWESRTRTSSFDASSLPASSVGRVSNVPCDLTS